MYKPFSYKIFRDKNLINLNYVYPSIIWVESDALRIKINEEDVKILTGFFLILPSEHRCVVRSLNCEKKFTIHRISFLSFPDENMIDLSRKISESNDFSISSLSICVNDNLKKSINLLTSLENQEISNGVKKIWCNGFYLQLAEKGFLHTLFPDLHIDIERKLYNMFFHDPNYKHSINDSCKKLGLSKATLIRKLNQKNIKYKILLRQARMNYAVSLIELGEILSIDDVALKCGYQSAYRFQIYFKQHTGMSPREYMKTIATRMPMDAEIDE